MPLPIEIDCRSVHSRLEAGEPVVLIDCREPDEWATAKIEAATLIPMSEMQARVGELEPYRGQEIIVHCHHGGRSLRVANWMRQQGYENAQSMAGGIDEWSQTVDAAVPRY
jgi:rhodanese-related sulfurtransferase